MAKAAKRFQRGRKSAMSNRLPSGLDPAAERLGAAVLALVGRRRKPTTTRGIAALLRRDRAVVTPVVAALARDGRLVRAGRWGWQAVPGRLCGGLTVEGQPCRRAAVVGSDRCDLHQKPQPAPVAPKPAPEPQSMTWWMARNIITFLVRQGAIERPGAPAAGRLQSDDAGPVINAAIPGASVSPVLKRAIESNLKHLPKARRVLERDDPDWIRGFDAGTLTPFEYSGGVLMSEIRRRRATSSLTPPQPTRVEPRALADNEFLLDEDDEVEEAES